MNAVKTKYPILSKIRNERVFKLALPNKNDNNFGLIECCDNYFGVDFSADDMIALSLELKELAMLYKEGNIDKVRDEENLFGV